MTELLQDGRDDGAVAGAAAQTEVWRIEYANRPIPRIVPHLKLRAPSIEKLLTAATVCALLAGWFFLTRYGLVNPLFLPTPAAVWSAFVTTATTGYQGSRLDQHLLASVDRVLIGWSLACVVGVPLGFLMGLNTKIKAVFDPIIEFYRPLPPLGLYTLIVLWLGIGEESKIALLFLAALPPISISATEAVAGIDKRYITAVQSLGASRRQLLHHVILPACLPGICTGMRISLGFTYSVLVAAEIVAATRGIGWMVWDAAKFLLSDVVIMGLIVLGLTGLVLDLLLRRLERVLTPWRFI
ncbi:MAG TPA: ABC transporter permease subunit [Acetobacteraceae bacterium]|jgi:taurine transport system permease protein